VVWITTQVLEWQDRDGRFVQECQSWRCRPSIVQLSRRSGALIRQPFVFPDLAHETETLARRRFDQALLFAGITNRAPGGVQAGGQRGIRDDASVPDGANEVVLADDALPVADQVLGQIEHLWRD
jgi:hypothetical protein